MRAPSVRPFSFPDVTPSINTGPPRDLAALGQMALERSALAGSLIVPLRGILGWHVGKVLELDRAANEPVDIEVRGQLVGRGHIVIVDDEISVRVAEIRGDPSELF